MAIINTGSAIRTANSGGLADSNIRNYRTLGDGSSAQMTSEAGDWGFALVPASASTLIKTGAGQLGAVLCDTATGNITIYDGIDNTGTKIRDTSALVVGKQIWNVSFLTGLYITLSGAGVVSVTYR